ncbi:hypothetical protein GGGNBK_18945 [Sporosarcina sp. ANT_H38]
MTEAIEVIYSHPFLSTLWLLILVLPFTERK